MKTKKLTPRNVAPVTRENAATVSRDGNAMIAPCWATVSRDGNAMIAPCWAESLNPFIDPFAGDDAE
jgi:hypothetical protein